MTQRKWIFFCWMWHKELDFFFECDSFFLFFKKYESKNWTFVWKIWLTEWSLSFQYDTKNWIFLNITQRIEPFSKYDSKNWIFFSRGPVNVTQRIEPFFPYDSKNWLFGKRVKDLNPFFEYDTQNWTLFFFWLRLKESIFFVYDSQNWTLLFQHDS